MAYKPAHEELRELAEAIQEEAKKFTGITGVWVSEFASERLEALAKVLEAKHNAGMDALIQQLQEIDAESCATCRCFLADERVQAAGGGYDGWCRRNPPIVPKSIYPQDTRPPVALSDWCGEFRAQRNGG